MPRKLVIRDDDGNLLGKLGIPDDATDDEIAEAYETAKINLLAKRNLRPKTLFEVGVQADENLKSQQQVDAAKATNTRQIKCMACGEIQPYDYLAEHVETVCRPRVEELERQALRR